MNYETITRGGKEFAILPLKEMKKLLADAEMLADVRAYDAAKARLAREDDELIPFEVIERRLNGDYPLKIWREYRGLTQESLARRTRISRAMIAAIETGHKQGAVSTLKKLAKALDVDLEQLVTNQ